MTGKSKGHANPAKRQNDAAKICVLRLRPQCDWGVVEEPAMDGSKARRVSSCSGFVCSLFGFCNCTFYNSLDRRRAETNSQYLARRLF
jgi:hypothetical protein